MQTNEVIQLSTAPLQAPAPIPGVPFKPYRERLLRLSDVRFLTGLGRSSIYAAIAEGTFPSAVNVTDYAVAWRESEIDAWIAGRTNIKATSVPAAISEKARVCKAPESRGNAAKAKPPATKQATEKALSKRQRSGS